MKYLTVCLGGLLALTLAIASTFVSLAPSANAIPAGAAASVQEGFAYTKSIERVRTVCSTDPATSRTTCRIDRSQPPTVCHWVRDQDGNLIRDCY